MSDAKDIADMGATGRAALDAWLAMKAERDSLAAKQIILSAELLDRDTRMSGLEAALRKARKHIADIDSSNYADDDEIMDLIDATLVTP